MKMKRNFLMLAAVTISAVLQALAMNTFLCPVHLLPSGFTGLATIIEYATAWMGYGIPTSVGTLLLNVPIAIFCYKHVGKKFVKFSMLQVLMFSLFLEWIPCCLLFEDTLLNVCFGGVLYGLSLVVALRGNASTAGLDFIALYVSNRIGKSIWQYVFTFNTIMIFIFGYFFGWEYAGYSILFQFISTQTIDRFYHRFKRVTLQIISQKPDPLVSEYIQHCRHGITVEKGHGGYSGKEIGVLYSVVSAYEVQDLLQLMKTVDPHVIVNVIPTENFYGNFYQKPLE